MPSPTPRPLQPTQVTRGLYLLTVSAVLGTMFATATAGTFSTGFAVELGATDFLIGLLGAAPGFGQLVQFVSPFVIERLRSRKRFCVLLYTAGYLVWVPILLLPHVSAAVSRPRLLVVLLFVSTSLIGFAVPAGVSWMTDLIPETIRGRFMGRRNAVAGGAGLVVTLAAGRLVEVPPKLHSFALVFLGALLCGLAGVAVLGLTPEPPKVASRRLPFRKFVALPFRRPRFRSLLFYSTCRILATFIAAPFFVLYMLKFLHVPYFQIGIYTALSTLATMAAYPVWGYLADKYGNLPVMKVCAAALALIPGLWLFARPGNYAYLLPLFWAYGGTVAAGYLLAEFNLLMKIAPQHNRTVYLGTYFGTVGLAGAVGPVLGGALAKLTSPTTHLFALPWTNLHYVLLVSFVCRGLALLALRLVREKHVVGTGTMVRQIVGRHALSSLANLVAFLRHRHEQGRVQALHGLGAARAQVAVAELIQALDDSSYEVRREAARVLGDIGDRTAVRPLIGKLFDPAADIVEECAVSLGKLGDSTAVPALTELLNRPHRSLRKNAVIALGSLPGEASVKALWAQLPRERDLPMRALIADGLARHGEKRIARELRRLRRESHSPLQRRQLALSMARLLGDTNRFYALLQTDPLSLPGALRRLTRKAGATLSQDLPDRLRHQVLRDLRTARVSFEEGDHSRAARLLRRTASAYLTRLAALRRQPLREFLHAGAPDRESLTRIFGFLTALDSEEHARRLEREDVLLAFHAIALIAREGDRLRTTQP